MSCSNTGSSWAAVLALAPTGPSSGVCRHAAAGPVPGQGLSRAQSLPPAASATVVVRSKVSPIRGAGLGAAMRRPTLPCARRGQAAGGFGCCRLCAGIKRHEKGTARLEQNGAWGGKGKLSLGQDRIGIPVHTIYHHVLSIKHVPYYLLYCK